jgi:hypothetical protein
MRKKEMKKKGLVKWIKRENLCAFLLCCRQICLRKLANFLAVGLLV